MWDVGAWRVLQLGSQGADFCLELKHPALQSGVRSALADCVASPDIPGMQDIESGFFSPLTRLDIHMTIGIPIIINGHANRSRATGKTDRVIFMIHLRMIDVGEFPTRVVPRARQRPRSKSLGQLRRWLLNVRRDGIERRVTLAGWNCMRLAASRSAGSASMVAGQIPEQSAVNVQADPDEQGIDIDAFAVSRNVRSPLSLEALRGPQ